MHRRSKRKSNDQSVYSDSAINFELLEQRRLLSAAILDVPFEYSTGAAASIAVYHQLEKKVGSDSSTSLAAPEATSPGTRTSPGPVITTFTPTLSWQAITGATFTGYEINVYNLTARRSVSYETGASAESFTIPSTTTLLKGDSYAWNVRALDGAESGPASAYLYFQAPASVSNKLAAPVAKSPGTPSSPGPVVTGLTPTLSWQAISNATVTGYQINLYNLTSRRNVSYETGARVDSFTIPTSAALIAGDLYAWNVQALDGRESGPLSSYLYFKTAVPVTLPAPVASSPGSATSPGTVITALTPTLSWQAITGVTFTGYQINLYDLTTATLTSYQVGASVDSFSIPTALTAGHSYEWNVRALNGTVSGPPSANFYFQTQAQTIPTPASGTVEMIVNPVTGDVVLDGNGAHLVSLQVTSASDSLIPGNWLDLSSHGYTNWYFIEKRSQAIAEYDALFTSTGDYLDLNGTIDYGDIFKTTGSKDLVFEYGELLPNGTTIQTVTANVFYGTLG